MDNVFINEHNQLITDSHPNRILFVLHASNPQKYRAPSEVIFSPDPVSNKINLLFFSSLSLFIKLRFNI